MTDLMPGGVPQEGGGAPPGVPEGQGRLVGGRYRLLSPVGRGGMGMVWHAHDVLLDRDVAVKELILPFGLDHSGKQVAYRRMMREARSAARLSHPGIVTVHDVVEEDGRPWIVMELLRAWSLEQAVRQNGPLPVVQAAEIGFYVLDALRHAHAAGILHRDVKPGNVLITSDRVVLTDFGIAAIEGDVTITQTGLLMGSPAYIPPERLQGHSITHAADLWSFGATLYAAVEGRPPYEGPDAVAVLGAVLTQEPARPERAGALLPVIEGLLRKNPADRISAAQVADLLERVLRSHGSPLVGQRTGEHPAVPPDGLAPPAVPPREQYTPARIIETPSGPIRVPSEQSLPDERSSYATPYDPLASPSGVFSTNAIMRPASPLGAPPAESAASAPPSFGRADSPSMPATGAYAFPVYVTPPERTREERPERADGPSGPQRPQEFSAFSRRDESFDAFGGPSGPQSPDSGPWPGSRRQTEDDSPSGPHRSFDAFDAFGSSSASRHPRPGGRVTEGRINSGAFEAIRVSRANSAPDPALLGVPRRPDGEGGPGSRRPVEGRPRDPGRLGMALIDPSRLRRRGGPFSDGVWWQEGRPTPRTLLAGAGILGATVITWLLLHAGGAPPNVPPPVPPSSTASAELGEAVQQDVEIPEGFTTRTQGGISAVVPEEWTVSVADGRVIFSDPGDSQHMVTVAKAPSAPDGGLAALSRERETAKLAEYIEVQLQPVAMGRWKAADWEYTHTLANGVPMHTLTRHVTIDDRRAYRITFTAPELRWDEGARMREVFLAHFSLA